jgi:hypothetical protein
VDYFIDYLVEYKPFPKELEKEILSIIKDKKVINGGVIVAPVKEFKILCKNINDFISNKKVYGPDQVILNYTCYLEGFVHLNPVFNYVINNNKGFKIKSGKFFDKNNELIYIVHNAGGNKLFRSVKNFGYGSQYNQFSWITYFLSRTFIRLKLMLIPKYFLKVKNKLFSKK